MSFGRKSCGDLLLDRGFCSTGLRILQFIEYAIFQPNRHVYAASNTRNMRNHRIKIGFILRPQTLTGLFACLHHSFCQFTYQRIGKRRPDDIQKDIRRALTFIHQGRDQLIHGVRINRVVFEEIRNNPVKLKLRCQ